MIKEVPYLGLQEPVNCPRCKSHWTILIKPDATKSIFCSNDKCSFSWRADGRTLCEAVHVWNTICANHTERDRPATPVLVEVPYKGSTTVFYTTKKEGPIK